MDRHLLVLSVYGQDQAGTRLRACQYEPHLRAAGVAVRYWSFLSPEDSRRWFTDCGQATRVLLLLRSTLRLLGLRREVRRADVVLVLREVVPIATTAFERYAARRAKLVWDVDDAVWTEYPRLFARWLPRRVRRTARKYEDIAALADEVWAGSDVLAAWCQQHSSRVVVVPTVVDVPVDVTPREGRTTCAGWVGSASTGLFLQEAVEALAGLDRPLKIRCVGATDVRGSGNVSVACEPWTQAGEDDLLATVRIGLYPLSADHPLTPGKAGLKAVLYMANGLPCVVTPTATTAALVRPEVDGLHATTPQEWRSAVMRLLDDDDLWDRLSSSGHERAASELSLAVWGPRLAERVSALAGAA